MNDPLVTLWGLGVRFDDRVPRGHVHVIDEYRPPSEQEVDGFIARYKAERAVSMLRCGCYQNRNREDAGNGDIGNPEWQ